MDTKTIRKYLNAPTCPPCATRRRRGSVLSAFHAYLQQRWGEGCHNATILFGEIQAQGYTGRYTILRNYLQRWRVSLPGKKPCTTSSMPRSGCSCVRRRVPSPATVRWWLLGRFAESEQGTLQRGFVDTLVGLVPEVEESRTLAQEFVSLVKERKCAAFSAWLEKAAACSVPEFRSFAKGLVTDEPAVLAALSQEWSNGQVEGQVNRLKFLKRSMYGRGGFDLLRTRVLHRTGV